MHIPSVVLSPVVRTPYVALAAASLVGLAVLPPLASADILGLPIPGWQVNRWDAGSASPVDPPSSITLTTNTSAQSRSMFHATKQSVTKFQASFTYRFTGTASSTMGAAFVLHNQNLGASTVAAAMVSGVPTQLGYFDENGSFKGKSLAITLQAGYLGAGSSSTGVYSNGLVGGGSSAFVGFTGSTNSNSGTTQTISDFSYLVPSPGTTALLAPLLLAGRRRRGSTR